MYLVNEWSSILEHLSVGRCDIHHSEDHSVGTLLLLLGDLLEVTIDDGDSEHDTSSGTDGSHEVSEDAESTDTHSSKGGGSVDVLSEHTDHRLFAETSVEHHVVLHKLTDNISGRGARDVDPYAGEECAGAHHEGAVEEGVERISLDIKEALGRRDVVGETSDGGAVTRHVVLLPFSEELDEVVAFELTVEHLREEVQVGHEGSLENDGDVRGVEQLDGVRLLVTSHASVDQLEFNSEALL